MISETYLKLLLFYLVNSAENSAKNVYITNNSNIEISTFELPRSHNFKSFSVIPYPCYFYTYPPCSFQQNYHSIVCF